MKKQIIQIISVALLLNSSLSATEAITFSANYSGDYVSTISGGQQGVSKMNGVLFLASDIALKNGSFHISAMGSHGENPSDFVGDAGGVSNIATDHNTFKLYEAWAEKQFGKLSVLVGLHDLNGDFYVNGPALLFLNSSFGIGAEAAMTGDNGPSIFPSTAYVVRFDYQIGSTGYVKLGLYNALSGNLEEPCGTHPHISLDRGILAILEGGMQNELSKLSWGVWNYSEHYGWGSYLLYDQKWGRLHPFVRIGYADSSCNCFEYNIALGSTMSLDLLQGDQLGVALSVIRSRIRADESTWELTYKFGVPNFELQPSFQYIKNPGMDSSNEDAFVFIQRVSLAF